MEHVAETVAAEAAHEVVENHHEERAASDHGRVEELVVVAEIHSEEKEKSVHEEVLAEVKSNHSEDDKKSVKDEDHHESEKAK